MLEPTGFLVKNYVGHVQNRMQNLSAVFKAAGLHIRFIDGGSFVYNNIK